MSLPIGATTGRDLHLPDAPADTQRPAGKLTELRHGTRAARSSVSSSARCRIQTVHHLAGGISSRAI